MYILFKIVEIKLITPIIEDISTIWGEIIVKSIQGSL